MKYILDKKITFLYYIAVALLLILFLLFYFNSQKVKATGVLVDTTQQVLHKSDVILLDILNIESESRGYLISGNEVFLEPLKASKRVLDSHFKELNLLIKDNPNQIKQANLIHKIANERFFLSQEMVNQYRLNRLNDNEKTAFILQGKLITDQLRREIATFNNEKFNLLKIRKIDNDKSDYDSIILLILLLSIAILIFVIVIIITRNQKVRNREFETITASEKALSRYSLSLIEASLDPLVTINIQGKITDLNQATANITGVKRAELVGSDFFDHFTEPQKAREVYQEVFSNGFVVDSPLTIRHINGKLTDVLFNGSIYKDDLGKVLGVVIVARDIAEQKWATDLRNANKELANQNEEKEKRANELIIANEELAFQNQEKEKRANELIIANEELAFQNDEKENRAAELIIANEELAFQNNEKEKRAAELVDANLELAYQNKVKEKRAAELIIANKELAFQNEEKEKRASELVIANKELDFQNIEKEKRAAELVIANYARSIIEASLDPLITISTKGKITDMNQAFSTITEISRSELIGSNFFDYFTDPQKARDGYQAVFENGFVTDYPLTIKDGQLTDVLFNGSVYKDDKGNILGAVVVARDITEQKIIQKELIDAKIFAEKALVNAEKATKIAEDSVKSKQQFLSNMSHEIRTPMNAIIGFTKVVLKTDLTAKQKEYLTAIKMSGDALIVLINDILDLAKVDAGKMSFEKTPFKLALSISAMLHLFETKIKEKNLELVTNYDNTIPEVLIGDAVRLHQIILNLVSNAVKFTAKGKITVDIKLLSETDDNVQIEFAIKDTGIGIREDKFDSIFENFQQATSGTSRIYGGTGLGLAIVKQIVDAQEGTIVVESELGKGSNFSFILPFQKTNAEAVLDAEIIELDQEIHNIKVLVVEDMELNQLLMRTLLDDFGFDCDITANGKLAVEKLQTKSYDIILMDLQMPEMNGFEATEYIRKVMKLDVPIMALTADVTTVDLEKCKEVGMNDYVSKPVDERLLYSKIVSLIKKPVAIIEKETIGTIKTETIKYLDLNYLTKLTKANPILMTEMINVYLKQTPPLIDAMKSSLKNQDWQTLKAAAHKIIPSFTIMGLNKDYEEIASKIQEYASKMELSDEINELVLKLENICNNAYLELEMELNNLKIQTNENGK